MNNPYVFGSGDYLDWEQGWGDMFDEWNKMFGAP